jgi:lysozyme
VTVRVIDVSSAQGEIAWSDVARSGVRNAWLKATEGVAYIDPRFMQNAASAKRAGVRVGGYHYLRVRKGSQDGAAQAHDFCNALQAAGATQRRPMVDVETMLNEGSTALQVTAALAPFIAVVLARMHVLPIIYTSPGEWTSFGMTHAYEFAACPLWLAQWRAAAPHPPGPWSDRDLVLWQYDNKGRVPGIKTDVDLSVFQGSDAEFERHVGVGDALTVFTSPQAKTVAIIVALGAVVGVAALAFALSKSSGAKREDRIARSD